MDCRTVEFLRRRHLGAEASCQRSNRLYVRRSPRDRPAGRCRDTGTPPERGSRENPRAAADESVGGPAHGGTALDPCRKCILSRRAWPESVSTCPLATLQGHNSRSPAAFSTTICTSPQPETEDYRKNRGDNRLLGIPGGSTRTILPGGKPANPQRQNRGPRTLGTGRCSRADDALRLCFLCAKPGRGRSVQTTTGLLHACRAARTEPISARRLSRHPGVLAGGRIVFGI